VNVAPVDTVSRKVWKCARGTVIGEEIADNRFTIRTDHPNVKVSRQVTGIRQDPWAEANRIVVEQDKPPEELGSYLHPEAYGHPESRGRESLRRVGNLSGDRME